MTKSFNKGISAIGIIITLVVVGLLVGGIYFYIDSQTPKIEKQPNNSITQTSDGTQSAGTKTPIKCEFPNTIGGYTKQQVNDIGALATQEQKEASGLVSSIMVSYSGFNMISVTVFTTEDFAKARLTSAYSQGYKDCEIGNIKGLCKSVTPTGSNPPQFQKSMVWVKGKTYKTITNTEQQKSNESMADVERRVEGKIEIFASAFKDCEIQ